MDAQRLLKRFEALKARRDGRWQALWRSVRRYVYPTWSDTAPEGSERGGEIFDTTAVEARKRLAAGMYNWMAPPDKRWFEIVPSDGELAKDEEVKEWFAAATKAVELAMANSNWPGVLIQALNNLACGLDAVVYCEEGGDGGAALRFQSFPVETVCYSESPDGRVDTVFREFELTARQVAERFRGGSVPAQAASEASDPARADAKRRILHAVLPREASGGTLDNKAMPWASVYIDLGTRTVLEESGYVEFPFAVCRFEKSDNEQYGRGPGVDKLPDIRMLNRMRQAYILELEKQADPPWLLPYGSLVSREFDRDPGSVNIYKPDVSGLKPEPVFSGANLGQLAADIQQEREAIKQGFFWDIFDPIGDLRNITATEAEIRNNGKMIPFAPIAGNLHNELFRAVIQRVFGIVSRLGMLPPEVPAALRENPDYKIEFVSKIALSIKKVESLGWMQTEAALQGLSAAHPEIMDNFALDDVARDLAQANGASPKWLVPVKERDARREALAQAQQQAAAAQLAMQGAGLSGSLAKAPEPGSPLEQVMNGEGV